MCILYVICNDMYIYVYNYEHISYTHTYLLLLLALKYYILGKYYRLHLCIMYILIIYNYPSAGCSTLVSLKSACRFMIQKTFIDHKLLYFTPSLKPNHIK